jgi:valyl-tRNA synthetase
MPFITEYLYHSLNGTSLEDGDSVMVMTYPEAGQVDAEIEKEFDAIMDTIVAIRRAKALVDLGNQKIETAYIKPNKQMDADLIAPFIEKLGKVEKISFVDTKVENAISDVSDYVEVYIPTDSIDLTPIISRLEKQEEKLEKEIGKLSGMLNNERFVANAPEDVIAKNREDLASSKDKNTNVSAQLASLKS